MIKIVTDSTSDFTAKEIEDLAIDVVPLTVNFGEETFIDKLTISNEEFYERLANSAVMPVTSLSSPEAFSEVFRKYPEDDIVVITVAEKLSGTYQSALIAKDENNSSRIYVVESGNTTGGQNLLVRQACLYRDQNLSAMEIVKKIESLKERLVLLAYIDTLKYLVKGGRLSAISGAIGGVLKVKPIVCLYKGVIESIAKTRGVKAGVSFMVEKTQLERDPAMPLIGIYSSDSSNLDLLYAELKEDCISCSAGSVIGTHAGPNAVGIAYFKKL